VDAPAPDESSPTRAWGSHTGAGAALQSRPPPARDELEERISEVEDRFAGAAVPRPDFWSGFRVRPERIEFWSGRPSRLHERDVYTRDPTDPSGWKLGMLFP
jgi:pyridoxamine 5'-phosphate oxidase